MREQWFSYFAIDNNFTKDQSLRWLCEERCKNNGR
jgi:hypothetical protein